MIVLDASIVVELLLRGKLSDAIRNELAERREPLITPYLMDIEVTSAFRRLAFSGKFHAHDLRKLLSELSELTAERMPHTPLMNRIWELRHNFTCYDASYIALAEGAGATLYTLDGKLATGHKARVVVFTE